MVDKGQAGPSQHRFDDLILDTGRRTVTRGDAVLDINGLTFDLLRAIVSAAPNVVSGDELAEIVWSGRSVSPETITQRAKLLRDALGDCAGDPKYFEVIRGHGFRLIPDVLAGNSERGQVSRRSVFTKSRAAALIALAAILIVASQYWRPSVTERPVSVAVLPFVNDSAAEENAEFLSNGIHDELLTRLAKVGVRTISRTSVMEYASTTKNIREIGEELGVSAVVEGRVQRVGDSIRINVQLVDTATDEHLWAEVYDRVLTAEDYFAIQTQMTSSIAAALQEKLSPEKSPELRQLPTKNIRAYEFYLSGTYYENRPVGEHTDRRALQQFQRAVAEDPTFAAAWAAVSRAHSGMYWNGGDKTVERLEQARLAATRAFELVPDLPEAHHAIGLYYFWGSLDFEKALEHFTIAERGMPSSSGLSNIIAGVYRRSGDYDKSIEAAAKALQNDPRNTALMRFQAANYLGVRNAEQVHAHLDQMLEIRPDSSSAHEARVLFGLLLGENPSTLRTIAETDLVLNTRRGRSTLWLLALHERDFDEALRLLDSSIDDALFGAPISLFYGATFDLLEQPDRARANYQAAETQLALSLAERPMDWRRMLDRAEALVGLGRLAEGKQLAEAALELMPSSRDATEGKALQAQAILKVFAPAGDAARASELLSAQLASDCCWTLEGVLADPRLDSIRGGASFRTTVEKLRQEVRSNAGH